MGRRVVLTLLSAGLYSLAFPPWHFSWLAWVALAPFLLALSREPSPARGFLLGLSWGFAMIWGVGNWLPPALSYYYQQPLWFGVLFASVAAVGFIGIYHAAFAACACWLMARSAGVPRVVGVAALWVTWELAKARIFTGDPWLLIGYALAGQPTMIQIADLGGVYVLSFLLVLVNAAIVEVMGRGKAPQESGGWRLATGYRGRLPSRWRTAAVTLALVAAVFGYGRYRLSQVFPEARRVPVVVVQGNVDAGAQWEPSLYGEGLEVYMRLSHQAAPKDARSLIVWPESAVTFFLADEPSYRRQIGRMLATANADLVLGGPFREQAGDETRYFNSAFYLDAAGEVADRYDKGHLMPFAEYFPLRTIDFLRRRFERVRYFTEGRGDTVLDTAFGKIATVICFEGMFPEIVRAQMRRGAQLVLNLSNDAWLGRGAGPEQHLWMIALRAVENRTWVVRSTTTGISAVIDPYGRTQATLGQGEAGVLKAEIVPLRVETPYQRWGDVFAAGCVIVSLLALLAATRDFTRTATAAANRGSR